MRCRKVQQKIDAYIGNELSSLQHNRVAKHLSVCSKCTEALETAQRLQRLFREHAESSEPDQYFATRVMAAARSRSLLGERPTRKYLFWMWTTNHPGLRKGVAGASIVAGLLAGLSWTGTFQQTWSGPSGAESTFAEQEQTIDNIYGLDYFTDRPQGSLPDAMFSLVAEDNQRRAQP